MPLEVGGRRQRSEVRSQRSEDSIKTEVGGQKTESEIRGQHKDRGRRLEVSRLRLMASARQGDQRAAGRLVN